MPSETVSTNKLSLDEWFRQRNLARTNLLYLCNAVLGYEDVSQEVHGQVIANLQKFAPAKETTDIKPLSLAKLIRDYRAGYANMWELPPNTGSRSNLIMIPRGGLKSSIITAAHTIQWIINYPNVRILISSGTGDRAIDFVRAIKEHFQINENFRALFPEFCPQGNVKDWGNQSGFTVPNRTVTGIKEPTISVCAIGSFIAGGHFDVVMNDDLVDKENSRTPEGIGNVKAHFSAMSPLIERKDKPKDWEQRTAKRPRPWLYHGWRYLVGTIYNFSDLNYSTWKGEENKPKEKREWNCCVISAAPNYPEGPSYWPSRYPMEELRRIENDPTQGPEVLYSQYLMNPRPGKSGLINKKEDLRWIPESKLSQFEGRLRLAVTVDLAEMDSEKKGGANDYNVVNLHGFGTDGNLYLLNVLHTRQIDPDDMIKYLFAIYEANPRISTIKISKDHFARMLLPALKKETGRTGKFLPVIGSPIDNRVSKKQKIKGLQAWYANGTIRALDNFHIRAATLLHRTLRHKASVFDCEQPCCVEALQAKTFYEDEVLFFPKYDHDDILDTTADALFNAEGEVNADVIPSARPEADNGYRETGWGPMGKYTDSGQVIWEAAFPAPIAYVLRRQEELQEATDW